MTDTAGKALIEMHADAVRNLAEANERISNLNGQIEMILHSKSEVTRLYNDQREHFKKETAEANERIAKLSECLRDCREMMAHELSDWTAGDLIEKINEILGDRNG